MSGRPVVNRFVTKNQRTTHLAIHDGMNNIKENPQ